MKKRIVKKYKLRNEIQEMICYCFIALLIFGALFYQSKQVEKEQQQKEETTVVSVNFTR